MRASNTGLGILDDHRTAAPRVIRPGRERSGRDAYSARHARQISKCCQNDGLERGTLSARLRFPGHTPDVRVVHADSAPPTITFMLDMPHGEQQQQHRQLRPRRPRLAGVNACGDIE